MDVTLAVGGDGDEEPEEREQLLRRLRAQITELDVDSLRLLPGAAVPAGAKGADAVALGAIVVALSASGGVLTQLVELVRDVLGRQHARHRVSVTVDGDTLELERASADERRDVIDAFIRRHGPDR
ncbi:hypothetical protein ACH4OW_36795 [Streptomyces sp. NPDC017056]|uniref:effector-associated constant component EACC1 n=1 Tax=Streptomyces sp. NPDC017056 TaxID=3364973 RepID=UPI0037B9E46D